MAVGANTQVIGGILKTKFEDFVSVNVNNKNPLKDLFKFKKAEFAGSDIEHSAQVSRNVSPMFVGEDSAMAEAGAQGHVKVRIGQKKLMARIRLTSEAIHDSMKSEGAFKSARKDEMQGLIRDIARKIEYALATDGRGILALCAGDPTTTTVSLDSPGGIAGTNFGNRFIQPGMYIAFVNPATGNIRSGIRKVISCASTGASIVVDSAPDASVEDNDYVVQAASSSVTDVLDTSFEHGFWGLMALVDDGTYRNNYFNVDRSTWSSFSSYVLASTGALSADRYQQMADVVDQKLGGKTDVILMHHSTRRVHIQMTEADRRYSGSNLKRPDPGTDAFQQGDMAFGDVPVKAMRDFPLDVVMGLDKENGDWREYGSDPGSWVDDDNQVLVRVGTGGSARDAFEAWYRMRKQWYLRYPGYQWRMDGVTGQSLIVVRAE